MTDDLPRIPAAAPVPDLLAARPVVRVDADTTRAAMTFAFVSGVSGGLFEGALASATLPASSWDPAAFAQDLFVTDVVARVFRFERPGADALSSTAHVARVLVRPPSSAEDVAHRQAIASELALRPELRRAVERLHGLLLRFRTQLEGSMVARKYDPNRRQLEILATAKEIFDVAAEELASARSGLARIHAFGAHVRAGEPYASLASLLSYDEHLATMDLRVRVGADGRIHALTVGALREDATNPFVASPLRRWVARLELFARGYSLSDGEVLSRLIDAVFEGIAADVVTFVQLLGDLEVYLGALAFRDAAAAAGLETCLPRFVDGDAPRAIEGLFNPLLLAHGVTPVPCDVRTDRHATTVLVTGPNSGGKTRLLQALGLAQLLGQSGFFVPARAATIAPAGALVMSLIQETTPDQSEGRLGMELVRIRALFEQLPPGAMVMLDELCSGTNPSEGEEIFELVVEVLGKLGPQAFITTHFLGFAARLERERTVDALRFLQVELDAQHRATYQFVGGVARTSLASHAAARLGVTAEQLHALVDRSLERRRGGAGAERA